VKSHEHTLTQPQFVTSREYVQACLNLVNWREGDAKSAVLVAISQIYGTDPFTDSHKSLLLLFGQKPELWKAYIEKFAVAPGSFADGLRKRIGKFLSGSEKDRKALRATRDSALEAVNTEIKLEVAANGELIHRYRYIPKDQDAKEGLLLAFLFSAREPFGKELRQCPFCKRYFLATPNTKGGPRPKFCPGTDHQVLYDDSQAPMRSRKNRARATGQRALKQK
jgi:hypothetical protein